MKSRPTADELAPYQQRYVDFVSEDDICAALEAQGNATASFLSGIGEQRAAFRYAPDKWSIKQVAGHMTDCERIFGYRALSIARADTRPLPGFDENEYGAASNADERTLAEIVEELRAVRRSTVALFRGVSDEAWTRAGTANDHRISVRALAFVTLGHERHHLKVLRERYLNT